MPSPRSWSPPRRACRCCSPTRRGQALRGGSARGGGRVHELLEGSGGSRLDLALPRLRGVGPGPRTWGPPPPGEFTWMVAQVLLWGGSLSGWWRGPAGDPPAVDSLIPPVPHRCTWAGALGITSSPTCWRPGHERHPPYLTTPFSGGSVVFAPPGGPAGVVGIRWRLLQGPWTGRSRSPQGGTPPPGSSGLVVFTSPWTGGGLRSVWMG